MTSLSVSLPFSETCLAEKCLRSMRLFHVVHLAAKTTHQRATPIAFCVCVTQRGCVESDGVGNGETRCLPSEVVPLTHRDSLATKDNQCEVVLSVSVPSYKHICDGHAMVILRPHPPLGRGGARKPSNVRIFPN